MPPSPAENPSAAETAQTAWLLCALALARIGGVMLMLRLDGEAGVVQVHDDAQA